MKRIAFSTLVAALVLALPSIGAARTDRELTYRETEIWNGAIRFLRVDSGFKILEKDRDAGYVLFEYQEGGAGHTASFEMVSAVKDGRVFVRARIQISEMPRYVEAVLIDRLIRKLRDEYGDPPPASLVQFSPQPLPEDTGAAKKGDKEKNGSTPSTGKPLTDEELDPEAQDEAGIEVTEDDVEQSGE
jgi:hypothetical protein